MPAANNTPLIAKTQSPMTMQSKDDATSSPTSVRSVWQTSSPTDEKVAQKPKMQPYEGAKTTSFLDTTLAAAVQVAAVGMFVCVVNVTARNIAEPMALW